MKPKNNTLEQKRGVSHTPGPWMICPNEPDADTWHITGFKGRYICGIDMYPGSDKDARLIAASPELLEACKEAYRLALDSPSPAVKIDICDVLRNAIAKATN